MDALINKIKKKANPSVIGLDPLLEYIPGFIKEKAFKEYGKTLKGAAEAIYEYNASLIDELCDIVPAIKPQSAYYELYGYEGVGALAKTIEYAKSKGLYVIADVKRNDIGSTAAAYAKAYLGQTEIDGEKQSAFGADAVTVNAYLGTDGLKPFIDEFKENSSVFVLVKTSNKSSGEMQDLTLENGKRVYMQMAELISEAGKDYIGKHGYSSVGAVVGATYPEQLRQIREKHKHLFFLIPGFGFQGGTAKDIAGAFDEKGLGAIVNSSRGIMLAYKNNGLKETDYLKAARKEAIRMKEDIQALIG